MRTQAASPGQIKIPGEQQQGIWCPTSCHVAPPTLDDSATQLIPAPTFVWNWVNQTSWSTICRIQIAMATYLHLKQHTESFMYKARWHLLHCSSHGLCTSFTNRCHYLVWHIISKPVG
jgi:hypothetical protein